MSYELFTSIYGIFNSYFLHFQVKIKMTYFSYLTENQILLSIPVQAAISDCSEAVVQSCPFSNISPENPGCRVLVWVKLIKDSLFRVAIIY